jgi:hypothetical protein
MGRGRAVQPDSIKTRVESAYGVCNQRLKLQYDETLSNFAFNFNLRHYNVVSNAEAVAMIKDTVKVEPDQRFLWSNSNSEFPGIPHNSRKHSENAQKTCRNMPEIAGINACNARSATKVTVSTQIHEEVLKTFGTFVQALRQGAFDVRQAAGIGGHDPHERG